MAAKTRAILLAVVLLSAGLAGCADTGDETGTDDTTDGDTDTGDRDTGDRDTGDTGDRDTNETGDDQTQQDRFERTFNDTIDEQNYMRNWTVPANTSNANVTIEANVQGDAVDDFEATLYTPEGEEVCTVSDSQTTGTVGMDNQTDGENMCEEQLENTGEHRLTVWGNSTAGEAEYTLNVTVEPSQQSDSGQMSDDGGGTGIYGPVQSVTRS